jgi:aspartate kinase
MVAEAFDGDGRMQMSLTIAEEHRQTADEVARDLIGRWGGGHAATHAGLSRIALVGHGMHGRPGVYATAYRALLDAGVEVQGVSTSTLSITVLVPTEHENAALRALHDAFRFERTGGDVAEH